MDPYAISRRLIELAAEAEPIEFETRFPWPGMADPIFAQAFEARERYLIPAKQMIGELQEALDNIGWNPDISNIPNSERDRWTFGTAMTIRGAPRPIHRGFLQPVQRMPILTRVPDRVARFLIAIEEGVDYLENETHSGVGWHYHYLNWRKDRSDVVLCWDTRWVVPHPQSIPPARRGLFVEKHAEGGKPFNARPRRWGPKKRETMYAVCTADLGKRRIEEYRCAANKSEVVYPPGATLTPHPSSVAAATGKPTGKCGSKGKKRRR